MTSRNAPMTAREKKALELKNTGRRVVRTAVIGGRVTKANLRKTAEASRRGAQT